MTFLIRSFALKAPSDSEGRRACYHNYDCGNYGISAPNMEVIALIIVIIVVIITVCLQLWPQL